MKNEDGKVTQMKDWHQGATAGHAHPDAGDDLSGLSDAAALERIDRLRLWARQADSSGHARDAGDMLGEAARIAQHNYVGADVIGEYADFLDSHGHPAQAAEWRGRHEELTAMLREHGGPFDGYEASLRAERAQGGGEARQRVAAAVSDAGRAHRTPAFAQPARRRNR